MSRSTFISPRFPDQIRNLWKGDPSEQSVRIALALAGDLIQELIDLRESMETTSESHRQDHSNHCCRERNPLMTTIYHQQAAIQAGAKALAEHQIGEDWGDDGVTFIGCDCGQWFGKQVNDGEELARIHEAQAALTAATPHLRAAWEQPIRELCEGALAKASDPLAGRMFDGSPFPAVVRAKDVLALLEGGGE